MKRIELHTDTIYSRELSFLSPFDLIRVYAKAGYDAIALTDYGSTAAFPEAEAEARRCNLRLIYGLTLDCVDSDDRYAITVLAKDQTGLEQLFQLQVLEEKNRFPFGPCITRGQLEECRSHLLVGSCAKDGQLIRAVQHGRSRDYLMELASSYDYLELYPEPYEDFVELLHLGRQLSIPICAVQQARIPPQLSAAGMHAYRAIASARRQSPADGALLAPEVFEQDFTALYALPEEKQMVSHALWTGPEQILAQIQPIQPLGEQLRDSDCQAQSSAMELLEKKIQAILLQRFPHGCPSVVSRRVEQELEWARDTDAAQTILLLADATSILHQDGALTVLLGAYNASYLLFLLGITDLDPLPYHGYCPVCGHWEQLGSSDSGKNCPQCGTPWARGGHNLEPVAFLSEKKMVYQLELRSNSGIYPKLCSKLAERYPNLVEHRCMGSAIPDKAQLQAVTEEYIAKHPETPELSGLLRDREFYARLQMNLSPRTRCGPHQLYLLPEAVQKRLPFLPPEPSQPSESLLGSSRLGQFPSLFYLESSLLDVLRQYQEQTGIPYSQIPLGDSAVYQALTQVIRGGTPPHPQELAISTACCLVGVDDQQLYQDLISWFGLSDLHTLTRIYSFGHSFWLRPENVRSLLEQGVDPAKMITCREDVYRYLVALGMGAEDAANWMERVYRGHIQHNGFTPADTALLESYGAEPWFIQACSLTNYLWPESHSTIHCALLVRLVWYILHFPQLEDQIVTNCSEDDFSQL